MQDTSMVRKAEEIQGMQTAMKEPHRYSALTEKSIILKSWAEHFRSALNCSSAISDAAIDRLPQVDMNNDLDLPPKVPERIPAVQHISSAKAPESDAFPPEVYKHGWPWLMAGLTTLFQVMWHQGQVPQDFKDATVVQLYKRKGNRQLCHNHRGISHRGFRRYRGTSDKIFVARKLQEESQEMRTHRYTTFMDPMKAVGTVNRNVRWKIMQQFGCPERFTHMVRQPHDGIMACASDNWTVSEAFTVTNGVKQACVLAPTLLSLMDT
ncbi:unnamed protein product [Schistocephalus solidus]|uniref:Reverse transcriptase domain-containing protein n=1 Tax=Schistocephalus solidus TaxID=70667 RepID=A0A183SK10_SCHSO|nr:unnamed protein product [Schistocephalus solidus]